MRIQLAQGPMPVQPSTVPSQGAQAARERAMAALVGGNTPPPASEATPKTQETPVANPNQVSPEEMSALKPTTESSTEPQAESQPETQETKQPEQDPEIKAQFEKLAKQEKAIRLKAQQQEQALKAREEALKAKEAELLGKQQPQQDVYTKDQIKAQALKILAEAGVSYEDITNQILNQQPVNPQIEAEFSTLKAEIKRLNEELTSGKKAVEEREKAAYQAAVKQIRNDVDNLVSHDPEFETIKATGSQQDVVELIERVYKEDGVVMSIEDAAKEIENYLVDEALKVTKINKIKARLENAQKAAQPKPVEKQPEVKKEQSQPQPMKTLTNAAASSRKLSARERAILAMQGQLKS